MTASQAIGFLHTIQPLYVLSGLFVGTLVGLTGVGGGSLMTPILILVFGIHPATAVGTDLLYASATKTVGTFVHGYNRNVDWRVVGRLALGSVPMTALTIFVLSRLNLDSPQMQSLITKVLGAALLVTAFSLFFREPMMRLYNRQAPERNPRAVRNLTILTGAVLGVLVSISSVGAGAIGVTALIMLYPAMPASRIVGSDIAHAVPLTLVAGVGHWLVLSSINWAVLELLLVGSLPGIVFGSVLASRVPDWVVRITLGVTLLLVCARFWFF